MKKQLGLIAAVANNRVIGFQGRMPWPRIPEDMKHFAELTRGHPVIMGRKTYQSLKQPLIGRTNVVVSRDPFFMEGWALKYPFIDFAIDAVFSLDSKVYIIGGQEIYEQTIDKADFLELTRIHADYKGDRFFPVIDNRTWGLVSKEEHKDNPNFTFERYERR